MTKLSDVDYYRLTGEFFGYPKCCIDFFTNRFLAIAAAKTQQELEKAAIVPKSQRYYVHGFVPCPKCAESHPPGQEHKLITNRICSEKYPNNGSIKEQEEFIESRTK